MNANWMTRWGYLEAGTVHDGGRRAITLIRAGWALKGDGLWDSIWGIHIWHSRLVDGAKNLGHDHRGEGDFSAWMLFGKMAEAIRVKDELACDSPTADGEPYRIVSRPIKRFARRFYRAGVDWHSVYRVRMLSLTVCHWGKRKPIDLGVA